MMGGLADSPWKILIVAVVLIVLLGAMAWVMLRALADSGRH